MDGGRGGGRGRGCVAFTTSVESESAGYKLISSIKQLGSFAASTSAVDGKELLLTQVGFSGASAMLGGG